MNPLDPHFTVPPEQRIRRPSMSFCVTSMARTHHLKKTVPHNLELFRRFLTDYELLLVNYNSPDDMDAWVHTHLASELEQGLVRYFHTRTPSYFNHSHAKNIAHRRATKDLVVNVDADNFLSLFYLLALSTLQPSHYLMVPYGKNYMASTRGRIALYREHFLELGGYDEDLTTCYGAEDDDMIGRCRAKGLRPRFIQGKLIGSILQHSDQERLHRLREKTMDPFSGKERSRDNIALGNWRANAGGDWGSLENGPCWDVEESGPRYRLKRVVESYLIPQD